MRAAELEKLRRVYRGVLSCVREQANNSFQEALPVAGCSTARHAQVAKRTYTNVYLNQYKAINTLNNKQRSQLYKWIFGSQANSARRFSEATFAGRAEYIHQLARRLPKIDCINSFQQVRTAFVKAAEASQLRREALLRFHKWFEKELRIPLIISLTISNNWSSFCQKLGSVIVFELLNYSQLGGSYARYEVKPMQPSVRYMHVPEAKFSLVQASRYMLQQLQYYMSTVLHVSFIATMITPLALSYPIFNLQQSWKLIWYRWMRWCLTVCGPVWIKWGQWASSRKDVFSPQLCSELNKLCTSAPSHSYEHTKNMIEQSFNMPVNHLFEYIQEQPTASGSIAQVHLAVLSPAGAQITGMPPHTKVAIKVRHPAVTTTMPIDYAIMLNSARLVSLIPSLSRVNLTTTVEQFAAPLQEQVDLQQEARYLTKFSANFKRDRSQVQFPTPLYPLVGQGVLVETWMDGEHIDHFIQQINSTQQTQGLVSPEEGGSGRGAGTLPAEGGVGGEVKGQASIYNNESTVQLVKGMKSQLATLGTNTLIKMMLRDNLIHADLHPGNILVVLQPPTSTLQRILAYCDNVKQQLYYTINPSPALVPEPCYKHVPCSWLVPKVVLLDTGMAQVLSPADKDILKSMFVSFTAHDGAGVARNVLSFAGDNQKCSDQDGFVEAVDKYFDVISNCTSWDDIEMSGAAAWHNLFDIIRQHEVTIPGHICAVLMTSMVMEGWSSDLDPEHSVFTVLEKVLGSGGGGGGAWNVGGLVREVVERGVGKVGEGREVVGGVF